MRIAESVFLVTGGASGLGAASARRLADLGANVVIADLHPPKNENQPEPALRYAHVDVTNPQHVQGAIRLAVDAFGRLDGVVQCAGIVAVARILGRDDPHDLELFSRVVQVNLIGVFNVLRLASAALARNEPNADGERGVIVNTASVAAFDGQIGQAAYAASKAGVAGMTLPAARDLARHGIRVVAVAPGVFDTPMMGELTPAVRQSLAAQVPFPPRLGRPEEFAMLVEQIILNPMLNGEVIRLDGALRMPPK